MTDTAPTVDHRAAIPAAPARTGTVPTWVRVVLVALGIPNAAAGLWAVLAPSSWYDSFPGFGTPLVAAEPPYNAHLATDAGAGLLASGIVLLLAAWLADRRSVALGVIAFAAFSVPHAAYHVFNPAPGLSVADDAQNAVLLVFTVVVSVVVLAVTGRRTAT
ncbi:MAG: hypothetical protein ACRD2C_19565 [Acidimicrobiales bacterium]